MWSPELRRNWKQTALLCLQRPRHSSALLNGRCCLPLWLLHHLILYYWSLGGGQCSYWALLVQEEIPVWHRQSGKASRHCAWEWEDHSGENWKRMSKQIQMKGFYQSLPTNSSPAAPTWGYFWGLLDFRMQTDKLRKLNDWVRCLWLTGTIWCCRFFSSMLQLGRQGCRCVAKFFSCFLVSQNLLTHFDL